MDRGSPLSHCFSKMAQNLVMNLDLHHTKFGYEKLWQLFVSQPNSWNITGTTLRLRLQISETLHLKQRRVSNIIQSRYTVVWNACHLCIEIQKLLLNKFYLVIYSSSSLTESHSYKLWGKDLTKWCYKYRYFWWSVNLYDLDNP